MKKWILFIFLVTSSFQVFASYILNPIDAVSHKEDLKAYGTTY